MPKTIQFLKGDACNHRICMVLAQMLQRDSANAGTETQHCPVFAPILQAHG